MEARHSEGKGSSRTILIEPKKRERENDLDESTSNISACPQSGNKKRNQPLFGSAYQGYTFPQKQPLTAAAADDDDDDNTQQQTPPPPQLDRVHASELQNNPNGAALFFRDYVATRRPCIIEHWWPPDHGATEAMADRMVQHLLQSAAMTTIAVEERDDNNNNHQPFGQGRRVDLTIREFWNTKLATQRYYLSTQTPPPKSKDDDDDQQQPPPPAPFYGPPCQHLHEAGLLPDLIPRLTGNLQLSSCNLWVGCCGSGSSSSSAKDSPDSHATRTQSTTTTTTTTNSSSGLHHDFHDNFYCLLQGRKRFYLYAPTEARALGIANANLHTTNGLLSYQPHTRDDGRVVRMIAATTATTRTDAAAVPVNDDDDDDDSEEEVVWGKGFDYQSSDDDDDDAGHVAIDANGDEGDAIEAQGEHDDDDDDDDDDDETTNELPNHFSWIDPTAASRESIAQTFPAYAHTTECIVELQAGEILYLPASWFHCVVSMAADNNDNHESLASTSTSSIQPKGVHMAINYWFHPPDNLTDFAHPYRDREYWEHSYKQESQT